MPIPARCLRSLVKLSWSSTRNGAHEGDIIHTREVDALITIILILSREYLNQFTDDFSLI